MRLILVVLFFVPALAFAQPVAGDCPATGDGDAVECLLANLNAALPAGCQPIDFKALGKKIKETPHIGLFAKIRLGTRAKGMMDDARDYDAQPSEEKLTRLKREYDDLFGDFIEKLDGKDPALVAEMRCARGAGFDVLLLSAKRENERRRREGGSG